MYKLAIILFFLALPVSTFGQSSIDKPDEQRPIFTIGETISRNQIALAEKDHREMRIATIEINQLAKSLLKAAKGQCLLSNEDEKKLEKIEKLAKKVRSEQGGNGNNLAEKPESLIVALERLQKAAETMELESRSLNRHSISFLLVEKVNEVLGLTKEIKKMRNK
ncbi:MAG: hypothetical protein HY819_21180 [Acidobacteria bacterium]|nr:hypothetical protein [Acidobacteriota bacterium]